MIALYFTPWFNVLWTLGCLLGFTVWPTAVWSWLGLLMVGEWATAWWLQPRPKRGAWRLALLPTLLAIASGAYLLIVLNQTVKVAIILMVVLVSLVWWRQVYYYLRDYQRYLVFSLENFSF